MQDQLYVFVDKTGHCFEDFQAGGENGYKDHVGAMMRAKCKFTVGDMLVFRDDLQEAGFKWGQDFYVKKCKMNGGEMQTKPQRPKYKKKKRKKRKTQDEWTITDWKGWLWEKFSQFIRLRDCLGTTGSPDYGHCVTCQRTFPRKKLQAGHFVPGRTDAILFDEDCTHAQCYRCNCVLDVWPEYYRWMQKEYGQEKIEQLIDQRLEKVELTVEWIQEVYEYYEKRIEEMLNGSDLLSDTRTP